jgi:hypothetical protein
MDISDKELGGFDLEFFLYSEETDFCLRLRELGFAIGYIPEIAVSHIGGALADALERSAGKAPAAAFQSVAKAPSISRHLGSFQKFPDAKRQRTVNGGAVRHGGKRVSRCFFNSGRRSY